MSEHLANRSTTEDTLAHCMKIANSKIVICTPDLATYVRDLFVQSKEGQPCLSLSLSSFGPLQLSEEDARAANVTQIRYEDFQLASTLTTVPQRAKRNLKDIGALVYTSGTSGKPKAVSIKNFLLVFVSTPTSVDVQNPKRYFPLRTYSCLPLFHATCLFTGLYYSVGSSSTFCLGRKFSASRFARTLTTSGATRLLYVGELCRYLLAAVPSEYDQAHKCIVASGNGLQKDIWEKFRRRYNIPEIREFYRSTEGIAKFDNFSRGAPASAGMVGFSGLLKRYFENDIFIVKYDSSTEQPYRDPSTGFCTPAALGEPGEAIGRVRSMDFYNEYLNNPGANKLKLIENVFENGDLFQRTGDLLVHSKRGWIRFHDRSGDTFRWRGENVSAGEVREQIARLPNVHDASVYGVKLDG
jgi:acyl-CoA synthetase (AMP-forming)/AMP-acid ligase II